MAISFDGFPLDYADERLFRLRDLAGSGDGDDGLLAVLRRRRRPIALGIPLHAGNPAVAVVLHLPPRFGLGHELLIGFGPRIGSLRQRRRDTANEQQRRACGPKEATHKPAPPRSIKWLFKPGDSIAAKRSSKLAQKAWSTCPVASAQGEPFDCVPVGRVEGADLLHIGARLGELRETAIRRDPPLPGIISGRRPPQDPPPKG